MHRLRALLRVLWAFFVDDGPLAAGALAWLALTWLLVARLRPLRPWSALLLFAGLGGILIQSALRTARRRHPGQRQR